jgi:tripartite-type tricarboxylate transporter receptor subunit TctC
MKFEISRRLIAAAVGTALIAGAAQTARAADPADFYKGKNVTFIIGGSGLSGGYDTYSRLIAAHIGAHLPGNPTVVPQNMPGAGGIRAANYLYAVAPKDGLSLGMIDQAIYLNQILGKSELKVDATKFNWIGRMLSNTTVLFAWKTADVKTIQDAYTKQLVVSAPGSASRVNWTVLNNALGMKFKIISGYAGSNEGKLAMQRGEVQGLSMPWPLLKAENGDWLKDGSINLLLQTGAVKADDLQNLPRMIDLAKDEDTKQLLELFSSPSTIGRSVVAPPGIPADRVALLRTAFMEAIKDPDLVNAAKQAKLDLDPLPGDVLQASIGSRQFPPALIERARKMVEGIQ